MMLFPTRGLAMARDACVFTRRHWPWQIPGSTLQAGVSPFCSVHAARVLFRLRMQPRCLGLGTACDAYAIMITGSSIASCVHVIRSKRQFDHHERPANPRATSIASSR